MVSFKIGWRLPGNTPVNVKKKVDKKYIEIASLNPNLTVNKVKSLIIDVREKLSKFYAECETDFKETMELFNSIVKKISIE